MNSSTAVGSYLLLGLQIEEILEYLGLPADTATARPRAREPAAPTKLEARRDRIDKLADYAAFGVRWVWLIDLGESSLEVRELVNKRQYREVLSAGEGSVPIPGCMDLTLDLDALWAELDRLGPLAS